MSNWIIALMLAAGAATWIYTKLMRSSGNNSRSSLVVAGVVSLLLFVLVFMILSFITGRFQE